MTEDEAARMIDGISVWDRAIVVYPIGQQSGVRFIGMSAEQAAEMLYRCADEIVRQCVPSPAPKGIQ